jgi:6-phosphogluconolactonase
MRRIRDDPDPRLAEAHDPPWRFFMKRIWLMSVIAILLFLAGCGGASTGGANSTGSGANPVPNPIPTISSIDPSSAPVGAQAFTLRVVGTTNFVTGSVLRWNGNDRPTTILSGHALNAQIPASDIAATGTAAVSVFNPLPGGGSSNSLTFTIAIGSVSPESVAVDPTGKFAYVANSTTDNVSMYTVNTTTGILTPNGMIAAGSNPVSIVVHPSGKFVYVANDTEIFTSNLSIYKIDPNTGILTSIGSAATFSCTGSLAIDPSGGFAYAASSSCGDDIGNVSTYTINATTGTLTLQAESSYPIGLFPWSIAVHPSGKFAYVANVMNGGCAASTTVFSIDSGVLKSIGSVATGGCPISVTVDPSGKFTYVANAGDNDLSMYTTDPTSGTLTFNGTIATGTRPASVAVDPTGRFAYVANAASNNISMYTINATTGTLTPIGMITTGSAPSSIAIHPSGRFAYVTNSGSNDVSMYSLDTSTGSLTFIGTIGT